MDISSVSPAARRSAASAATRSPRVISPPFAADSAAGASPPVWSPASCAMDGPVANSVKASAPPSAVNAFGNLNWTGWAICSSLDGWQAPGRPPSNNMFLRWLIVIRIRRWGSAQDKYREGRAERDEYGAVKHGRTLLIARHPRLHHVVLDRQGVDDERQEATEIEDREEPDGRADLAAGSCCKRHDIEERRLNVGEIIESECEAVKRADHPHREALPRVMRNLRPPLRVGYAQEVELVRAVDEAHHGQNREDRVRHAGKAEKLAEQCEPAAQDHRTGRITEGMRHEGGKPTHHCRRRMPDRPQQRHARIAAWRPCRQQSAEEGGNAKAFPRDVCIRSTRRNREGTSRTYPRASEENKAAEAA